MVQTQLLPDLVERVAVEVGDLRRDVQDGRNRVQRVLARLLFVIGERRGQRVLLVRLADDFDGVVVRDAVDPQRARFERLPVQEAHQPARRDGAVLRRVLVTLASWKAALSPSERCAAAVSAIQSPP